MNATRREFFGAAAALVLGAHGIPWPQPVRHHITMRQMEAAGGLTLFDQTGLVLQRAELDPAARQERERRIIRAVSA